MKSYIRRHRRFLAAGILAAFLAAWVLPVQACLAGSAQATAETPCPDCPYPCGQGGCATAACAASMLPTAMSAAPSLDKALPATVAIRLAPLQVEPIAAAPAGLIQGQHRPPSSDLNIRYCSFQN